MSRTIVDVQHLTFRYGDVTVLDDLSFTVTAGEYLGVIGPNGGGKTTLVKILLGLLPPTRGSVTLFGRDVRYGSAGPDVGYVPQRLAHAETAFPATVREVVTSGRTARVGLFRRVRHADLDAIDRALTVANVHGVRDRRFGELSGGERQRVLIARALAGEPKVLILDEPTVGVDLASQEKFYAFLADLNTHHGITIVFVTHDIDVIAREARAVLCLNHALVCHGSPREFIREDIMEKLYGRKIHFVHHEH